MSKITMNRREKILDKALEMFNERGIEYVGLRELAAELDMRVSNITYYFPTKDDLVFELSKELSTSNAEIIIASDTMTMDDFLWMLQRVYENHYRFRCLLRSFVHIMSQNKKVAEAYKKTQTVRIATIGSNFKTLVNAGYLKVEDEETPDFLVQTLSLISRFWISEAAIAARHLGKDAQIKHYLKLVTQLLWPYATTKARKEISKFRDGFT
jgi:AcrR family transcriptional regulator